MSSPFLLLFDWLVPVCLCVCSSCSSEKVSERSEQDHCRRVLCAGVGRWRSSHRLSAVDMQDKAKETCSDEKPARHLVKKPLHYYWLLTAALPSWVGWVAAGLWRIRAVVLPCLPSVFLPFVSFFSTRFLLLSSVSSMSCTLCAVSVGPPRYPHRSSRVLLSPSASLSFIILVQAVTSPSTLPPSLRSPLRWCCLRSDTACSAAGG